MKTMLKLRAITILFISIALMGTKCEPGFDADLSDTGIDDDQQQFSDYLGLGTVSELSINSDELEFELVRSADSSTILSGSYERFSATGFTRFDISGSETGVRDSINGFSLGNELWIVQSADDSSATVEILIAESDCPSVDLDANFITFEFSDTTSASIDSSGIFGDLSVSASDDTIISGIQYNLISGGGTEFSQAAAPINFEIASCSGGQSFTTNNSYYFSTNSVLIETNKNDALNSRQLIAIEEGSIDSLERIGGYLRYLGFIRDPGESSVLETLILECAENGEFCNLFPSDDVSVEIPEGTEALYTINFDNELNTFGDGIVTGTLVNRTQNSAKIACAIDLSFDGSGDMLMVCNGLSPADSSGISLVVKGE